jgi:hypothetical protein
MSYSYPLSLPTTSGIMRIRWAANDVVGVAQSPFTASQQVYRYTGQFWEADITLPPMKRADMEYWITFCSNSTDPLGLLLGDPNGGTPRGIATGTPLVNGAGQTGYELITDGWTVSQTGILKAGDYIQLGSATTARLYKVLDDVNSDASGNATLDLWPDLRSAPADNATITVSNAKTNFRLASAQTSWDINEATIYGLTFGAREAL